MASHSFEIEQLEQRILLSGNDLVQDLREGVSQLADTLQKIEVSGDLLAQDVAIAGGQIGVGANQSQQLEDIFAGLEEQDFSEADA